MGAAITTLFIASLVVSVAAFFVAIWRNAARRSPRTDDASALTAFTHALFAAPTSAEVRRVIARHLPTLVGTRAAWVSSYIVGRRQFIMAEDDTGQNERLMTGPFQEW